MDDRAWDNIDPEKHLDRISESGADLDAICGFALTFNGYTYWERAGEKGFERCVDVARNVESEFSRSQNLPDDLVSLRTALFFAQRDLHWTGDLGGPSEAYMAALVDRIRVVGIAKGLLREAGG